MFDFSIKEIKYLRKKSSYSIGNSNIQLALSNDFIAAVSNFGSVYIWVRSRLVTDQTRFKSEAGHSIFVCNYVFYEHPQLYFKLTMQFRSAVFGFMNQL